MKIVVLGMHRSGTSMVAGLINKMGAYIGPEEVQMKAGRANPKGFWERRDVMQINNKILNRSNAGWHRLSRKDFSNITDGQRSELNNNIRGVVSELNEHKNCLIKDPRMCITLPFWKSSLNKPLLVLVHRNPLEIAQSLKVRNGFPICFGILLWEEYMESALLATKNLSKIIVSHKDLMENPLKAAQDLHKELEENGVEGLAMPPSEEVTGFIDPNLYRARTDENLSENCLTSEQLELITAIESGDDPKTYRAVSQLKAAERRTLLKVIEPLFIKGKPKNKNITPIIGRLGRVTSNRVRGWASLLEDTTPLEVTLYVNGVKIAATLATEFRQVIHGRGIHATGKCGFTFKLKDSMNLKEQDEVRVVAAGPDDVDLTGSPRKINENISKKELTEVDKSVVPELAKTQRSIHDRMFFVHLPKTGGTSFKLMLFKKFKEANIYPTEKHIKQNNNNYPHFKELIAFNKEQLDKVQLLCAHYPFVVGDVFKGDITYVTFIRDPIKRCISFLFHLKRDYPDATYDELFEMKKFQFHNHQVRLYADQDLELRPTYFVSDTMDEQALRQAKENLNKTHFIGIQEEFDASINLFEKMFDVKLGAKLKANATKKSVGELDEALLNKIRKENALDIQFYKFACDKFALLKKKYQ